MGITSKSSGLILKILFNLSPVEIFVRPSFPTQRSAFGNFTPSLSL